MKMRRVAHWKNPLESAAYMTTYFGLLYYNLILSAAVSDSKGETKTTRRLVLLNLENADNYQLLLIIIMVLNRGYYPPTIPQMRKELERSEDEDAPPSDLSQFIEEHRGHDWVGKLIEQVGPAVKMQIEDVADVLEMLLKCVIRFPGLNTRC
jgi:hypothetical protein